MRKETAIILAGSFGIRKFISIKSQAYNDYYSDFHRHFDIKSSDNNPDGIEFLAMQ